MQDCLKDKRILKKMRQDVRQTRDVAIFLPEKLIDKSFKNLNQ